jgi:hypothetical protein
MQRGLVDRRKKALSRLELQLTSGIKVTTDYDPEVKGYLTLALTDQDRERIKSEVKHLHDYLNGVKKVKKKKAAEAQSDKNDKWIIDIYTVTYGYVKNSERRKKANKGKSKKKMKKVKTVSLIKSITAQPGMVRNYTEGRMGLSPKSHIFKLRRDVPSYF